MTAYVIMAVATFVLLLYLNRRAVFEESMSSFDECAFIVLYLVMALIWPLMLPVTLIVAGTRALMHYLMRGND